MEEFDCIIDRLKDRKLYPNSNENKIYLFDDNDDDNNFFNKTKFEKTNIGFNNKQLKDNDLED